MIKTLKTLLLAAGLCALSCTASQAEVNFSITVAPPLLPVYEQPPCPTDGYLWTPGYWAYDDGGYYWVEGVWVAPPRVGFLWTPGYWGLGDGFYAFHSGYWGPSVGFYGGVNYGYGYGGYGYGGGRWDGGRFRYNTAVTRVNTTVIHNTYVDRKVNSRVTEGRASFNGRGGVNVRPTAEQRQAANGPHVAPTGEQMARREAASREPGAHAAANGGRPAAAGGPRFPGGQGGTSQASRDAAVANERHQGQGREQRDAERQQARQQQAATVHPQQGVVGHVQPERAQQSSEGGRRAEAQQMQREAAGQRAQGGERQAQHEAAGQRAHAEQRQAQAQPAQRQERQAKQGQSEGHEKGQKHDGQDRQ